jgi:hypothetical protein
MPGISANTRLIIWIVVGVATIATTVLGGLLQKNLEFLIRNRVPSLRARGGAEPTRKPRGIWLSFWVCVTIAIIGTAVAGAAPDAESVSKRNCPPPEKLVQTKALKKYFEATFEDGRAKGFDHSGAGTWQVIDDGTGNKVYQANNPTSEYSDAHFFRGFKNGLIAYRFQLRNYTDEESGVVDLFFRVAIPQQDVGYVLRFIPNKKRAEVAYAKAGTDWPWLKSGLTPPDLELNTNEWNCVVVDVQGYVFKVFFNGKEILNAEASDEQSLDAGGLGFAVGPNSEVYFDEVEVWSSEAPEYIPPASSAPPTSSTPTANVTTVSPATPTSSAEGSVLLQEDFEDLSHKDVDITEERDKKGTWNIVDDGLGKGNDVLELSNPGDNSWAHIRIGSESWDFQNGFIEFQYYFKQYEKDAPEDEASIDFYFRKNPLNGQSYIIVIHPALGSVQFHVAKSEDDWIHLGTSTLNKQELDGWHLLRVEAQGNQIKIYIDDLSNPLLESNEDYRLPKGKISYDIREKTVVQLDNIRVVSQP